MACLRVEVAVNLVSIAYALNMAVYQRAKVCFAGIFARWHLMISEDVVAIFLANKFIAKQRRWPGGRTPICHDSYICLLGLADDQPLAAAKKFYSGVVLLPCQPSPLGFVQEQVFEGRASRLVDIAI